MLGTDTRDWRLANVVSESIEVIAIVIIAISLVVAFVIAARLTLRGSTEEAYDAFKRLIARGLLLSLDLLIAADIIRTVALEPTLENVAALGLLIVVRTFLAWTLVLETGNRWPWQQEQDGAANR